MLAFIIPYYKLTFFEATLQSLACQTDKRFNVYLGDDASPENPSFLLEKYKNQFKFNYRRFETNMGSLSMVRQWKRCVAMCGNIEWIMILGDDDVLGDNCVSEFYENIDKINGVANVIRYASCNIDESGERISKIFQNPVLESSVDFFFRERRSSLSEYVFNKEKILRVGLKDFPLAWCTDILAVLEVSDFGNVYSINKSIVYIRISEISISGKKNNFKLKTRASVDFLNYMIIKKGQYFNQYQKNKLTDEMIRIFLNNKRNSSLFIKLSTYFLRNNLFREFFNFLQLILVSFQNKLRNRKSLF